MPDLEDYEVVESLDVEEVDHRPPDSIFIRTVKGKNNLGKIVYSIAGVAGIAAPLTYLNGGNMESFNELLIGDTVDIVLGIIVIVLGVLSAFVNSKRKELVDRLREAVRELKRGKDLYDEFKKKESEQGEELSPGEYKQLAEQLAVVVSVLFNRNKQI